MVERITTVAPKTILSAPELAYTLPVVVANTGVSAENGKKIIKAGTPIAGDLQDRNTAFAVASDATVTGVVLHDVDVTKGNANATIVIAGAIDVTKVAEDVAELYTETVTEALNKITFMKGV